MRAACFLALAIGGVAAGRKSTCTVPACEDDCQAGDGSACRRLGEWRERLFGRERALPSFERGCQLGDATSCARAGATKDGCAHGSGWACRKAGDPRAERVARAGCDAADGDDCFALASLTPAGALALDARACDLGVPEGCAARAALAVDPGEKRLVLAQACAGGVTDACVPPASLPAAAPRVLYAEDPSAPAPAVAEIAPSTMSRPVADDALAKGLAAERSKDYATAWSVYDGACQGGDPTGCELLGFLAEHGLPRLDLARAVELHGGACRDGEQRGCYDLGRLSLEGKGLPQDDHRAAQLFVKTCESDGAYGCGELANLVRERRVPELVRDARTLAAHGCARDDATACEALGELMEEHGDAPGELIDAYDRACAGGSTRACLRAGMLFANGDLVTKDDLRAAYYFTLGCSLGDALSCYKARAGLEPR